MKHANIVKQLAKIGVPVVESQPEFIHELARRIWYTAERGPIHLQWSVTRGFYTHGEKKGQPYEHVDAPLLKDHRDPSDPRIDYVGTFMVIRQVTKLASYFKMFESFKGKESNS